MEQKILEVFALGIPLSDDTFFYLESTFGISELQGLKDLLRHADSSDAETILDLLFFPDTRQRMIFEPILQHRVYQADDIPLIVTRIMEEQPEAVLWRNRQQMSMALRRDEVAQYVSRLSIHTQLDQRTLELIQDTCSEEAGLKVRVRLRAAPFQLKDLAALFFQKFLTRFGRTERFWEYLDFVLGFLQECGSRADFQQELEDRKYFLEQALKRSEQLERDLKTQPVETLHMQRINILDLNREKIIRELETVEDLLGMFSIPQNSSSTPAW